MRLTDIAHGNIQPEVKQDCGPQRFLAYVRVSSQEQEDRGLSLNAQRDQIGEFAAKNDLNIVDWYKDVNSAFQTDSKLPDLERLMEHIRRDPSISGVIVHDYSRIGRDSTQCILIKVELLQKGLRIVSATEPEYDRNTTHGLIMDKMTELKNVIYSMDVAFHTRKGMRKNIAERDPEIGSCYKNGGAPLWGYKAIHVERSKTLRGEAIRKTLWELDDTIVSGRCLWEWTRHILIEMRLKEGASLDAIRDFLNEHGIPATRKQYWGTSSVHALLQRHTLLQYAGYGVWNVHRKKNRSKRDPSEWDVVENAHPAIISLEQAEEIQRVNQHNRRLSQDKSKANMTRVRTKGSRYLLSGGLFKCSRCGANMTSHRNRGRDYYICGASAYRKGRGCGSAFLVPKEGIEGAVVEEVGRMFTHCSDSERLKKLIEEELRSTGNHDSDLISGLERDSNRVDQAIGNIRRAVQEGLDDIDWANSELARLKEDKSRLSSQLERLKLNAIPMQVDAATVDRYSQSLADVLSTGTNEEKREFVRFFVKKVELDPDTGSVLIGLLSRPPGLSAHGKSTPAPRGGTGVQIGMVAGTGFEPATFGL